MIFYGMLKGKISKLKNIVNKDDLLSKCVSNNGNVESCGSSTYLEEIGFKIKSDDKLYNDFINLDVDSLFNKYHTKDSPIYKDINEYILKFGSRVTDELKMETVTMIEDNKIIYSYLKNLIFLEN